MDCDFDWAWDSPLTFSLRERRQGSVRLGTRDGRGCLRRYGRFTGEGFIRRLGALLGDRLGIIFCLHLLWHEALLLWSFSQLLLLKDLLSL